MSSDATNPDGPEESAVEPVTPPDAIGAADGEVADDALAALRAELEAVDDVPVGERVALFERANETLAAELAALDEV